MKIIFHFLWDHGAHSGYFENRITLDPVLGAYAASKTTLLPLKKFYSTRRFVVCLSVCHFVLVFYSPFSIAITSLGEERASLSAFRTFVRFVLLWICRFPLLLGVWEGLRFVIVALPGLFSYLFSDLTEYPIFILWMFFVSKSKLLDCY